MESQKKLVDYSEGEPISGHFLIQSTQVKVTKNNSAYIDCVITDNSASYPAKLWSIPIEMDTEAIKAADFVYITGQVELYNEKPQIRLTFVRPTANDEQFNKRDLIPIVDNPMELVVEIAETIKGIPDSDIRILLQKIFNDNKKNFGICPAAKSVHHAKIGGLALHICEMLRVAKALCDIFPCVNRSYLLAGVILHDFGKIREMQRNSIGLVDDYTREGKLLGHIVIGVSYIAEVGKEIDTPSDKILNLQHLILSHHGKPEFGSPKAPMCIEAEFLNYCDLISSRANMYMEATKDIESGEFAPKLFALGIEPYKI